MNLQRIWAVILRHFYLAFRDISRLSWMFYWPLFDIFTWGFAGFWVQQYSYNQSVAYGQLLALVLLQLVGRTAIEISVGLMEELWSTNMINIFASPLRLSEWTVALLCLGGITSTILLAYCSLMVWLIFQVNVMAIGLPIILFAVPLIFSGIWIGFLAATLIIKYGARIQTFIFILNWAFTPFCGVFYPIKILPHWAQIIAACIPMTYIFSALRIYLNDGYIPATILLQGYGMSIAYAAIAIVFFFYAFHKSKEKGLARLTAE